MDIRGRMEVGLDEKWGGEEGGNGRVLTPRFRVRVCLGFGFHEWYSC